MRIQVLVLALLAMPIAAGVAQSRGKGKVRSAEVGTDCKDQQAAALDRARDAGRAEPYGLDKKCQDPVPPPVPVPPPPSDQPPAGIHLSKGFVYEDVDGNGSQDMSAGEMGLAGWTVQLYWNGRLVASATTNGDGAYEFPGLGASALWSVCVVGQAGFNRTQPLNGDACGGAGYQFQVLESPFLTWYERHFGMMLP